jgi:hypothetical protein
MVRLLKVVERVLIIVGVGAFVWLDYIQLRYWVVMPREPDSASGRVYPYTAMRFHVYVTHEEADRGRLAEIVGPFGILAVMGGVPLLRWFAGRRPQR